MEPLLLHRHLPIAPALSLVRGGTGTSAAVPAVSKAHLARVLCFVALPAAFVGAGRRSRRCHRARHALPTRHLINDLWYHKVGSPEGPPEDDEFLETERQQKPVHLLQGHRDSYLHFMRHLLGKELEKMQEHIRLTDNSLVFISEEEALERGLLDRCERLSDGLDGLCVASLDQLLSRFSQGRRFSAELLVEKMYYVAGIDSAEQVQQNGETYVCRVVVPMKFRDAATGLDIEVHVELGEIPLLTEYGSLIISGNQYIIAHRLERSSGCYFSLEANDCGDVHILELVTEEYSRIRCRCQVNKDDEAEIFFCLPKSKAPLPAALVLLGMGCSEEEIRSARNGEWIWSSMLRQVEIEDDLNVEVACRELCKLLDMNTELWRGDAVAAFDFKTSWSFQSRVGSLGRQRLNQRLGLNLKDENLTAQDMLATANLLAGSFLGTNPLQTDDIDSLVNKRLRPVGLKMQSMVRDWLSSIVNKAAGLPISVDVNKMTGEIVTGGTPDLLKFCVSELWKENNRQLFEQLNPLAEIMQARRITQVSELGLDKIKRIQGIRLIHASQYGRVCPIETGEGMSAGIVQAMAANARITEDGELQAPHQPVVQGARLLNKPWEYLFAREQLACRVAQSDLAHGPSGALCAPARPERGGHVKKTQWKELTSVNVTHLGLIYSCAPEQVEYIACGSPVSVAVGMIPFLEHDDANRALMGAKHQQQSVPTLWPERPVVGTGLEAHVATYSGRCKHAGIDGQVLYADAQAVTVVQSRVEEVDFETTKLRGRLREFYLWNADRTRAWLMAVSYSDFNELLMRLPQEELGRLAAVLCGDHEDDIKKATLTESLARVGITPQTFHFEEEAQLGELPEGWIETEYCVRTEMVHQKLKDCSETKKHTLAHDTGAVAAGDVVCAGDAVAEGQGIVGGEVALGKNLVVAYMPWNGYNYEDAIAISARLVREDILTSVHVDEITMSLNDDDLFFTPRIMDPESNVDSLDYMTNGLPEVGTWLQGGDVAIYALQTKNKSGVTRLIPRTMCVPEGVQGRVIGSCIRTVEKKPGAIKKVASVFLAVQCRIGVGDKLSGRHGNKGIVSKVVEDRDMPYLPDGTPIDVCLNPLGVPSRMNVGQIFENLLGSAGRWNGEEYRVGAFDEMFSEEASRGLVFDALRRAQESTGNKWLLDSEYPGKTRVYDGKTGRPLEQPVTVGVSYIIKLCHMVRDKIHSRAPSAGGYNMLTQQPLKGRSKGGGLRLGEMEVSGLVGHGAPDTLQELLTLKSDDLQGRYELYNQLCRGEKVKLPQGATPEGYLTFRRELAASGLAVTEDSWLDD